MKIKKIFYTITAFAFIIVSSTLFAAFEAHVINVKAHIENALSVDTTPIDFGTVFPQEKFIKNFWIELSDSFKDERRVDDVKYEIHQKPKFREFKKADILFAFDTTGSMGSAIDDAKANATDIMNDLNSLIPDVAFGVAHFEDYNFAPYGGSAKPDSPYTLDEPITTNTADVQDAIDDLTLGVGGDFPQSYSRVMYESYTDPAMAWRAGSQRIVIILADDITHDNDLANDPIFGLNPAAESNPWVTGYPPTFLDPGPNSIAGDADDLDFQTVLKGMATNNIILFYLSFVNPASGDHTASWNWWAGRTGGGAVAAADFGDIVDAIHGLFAFKDLCPQLSKHKKPIDPDTYQQDPSIPDDVEVPVPHPAGAIASGYMSKLAGDIKDGWDLDLKVPCFEGQCDQTYDPEDFGKPLDANLEGQTFGCDLWIEVKEISETGGPAPEAPQVGANLGLYEPPENEDCDATVNPAAEPNTIAEGMVAAGVNGTVCVNPGTYTETVDIELVGMTLASTGGPDITFIDGGVKVNANNVTVKGFFVTPDNIEGTVADFYIKSNVHNLTIRDNHIDGPSVSDPSGSRGVINVAGGIYTNILIENNLIHELTTGVYTNPFVGGGTPFTIRYNDIDDNLAGIGGVTGTLVELNEFEHSIAGSEAIGADATYDGSVIKNNNFLDGTKLNDYAAGGTAIMAENNFWNLGGFAQTTAGEVDFTPETGSQYPHR